MELTVHDNGKGFDPDEPMKRLSIGLASMKERIKLVNGELSVHSVTGNGAQRFAPTYLWITPEPWKQPCDPRRSGGGELISPDENDLGNTVVRGCSPCRKFGRGPTPKSQGSSWRGV
jgi:hypothetical protein